MKPSIEVRLTPAMVGAALTVLNPHGAMTNRSAAAAFERIKTAAMAAGHTIEFDGEKYRVSD